MQFSLLPTSNQTVIRNNQNFSSDINCRTAAAIPLSNFHFYQSFSNHQSQAKSTPRKIRRANERRLRKVEKRKCHNKVTQLGILENSWNALKSGFSSSVNAGYQGVYNLLTSVNNAFDIKNFIPMAQASSTDLVGACQHPDECQLPSGTYLESCVNATVSKIFELCFLETYCKSIIPSIPPIHNTLNFVSENSFTLGNDNGTLILQPVPLKPSLSSKEIHVELSHCTDQINNIEDKLNNVGIFSDSVRKDLMAAKKVHEDRKNEVIGKLNAGDVVSFTDKGDLTVILPENISKNLGPYNREAYNTYHHLAETTGGIMGLSKDPKYLSLIIEEIFNHISQNTPSGKALDIAFVLDTTASMFDDLDDVKTNLIKFLKRLKETTDKDNRVFRTALLEFRDQGTEFVNRLKSDFTLDLDEMATALNSLDIGTPTDIPEAIYDALIKAKRDLSWNSESKKVVLLISDAPPHSKTLDQKFGQRDIVDQYKANGINIVIYPILTNK